MDGYVQGMHRSPHVGFALDFAQHRPYAPGDDIKRVDWRVFAKSERFYIKQHEVSTNLRAHIVLDASGSMDYRGSTDAMSKFRYGQFLAACLAYLILHQQDSAGLITFASKVREFIPPRSAPSHLVRLLQGIDTTRAAGESAISPLLHDVAERITGRAMVLIISDLFDDPAPLIESLHHLRHKRHEIILLQVLARDELEFPFRNWGLFENLEQSTDRVRLDPSVMRRAYLDNIGHHLQTIRDAAGKLNVSHELLDTSRPFDDALSTYLARRMGRK
ncbi:MAG TPA: DUF58 domain-containing protein [Tepidisphaeraceae bacterium]|nr:DUF58 domain-containing protein [Tepidisphaeraceae bacterium]